MTRNYIIFLGVGFIALATAGVFGFIHNTSSAASERTLGAAAVASDGASQSAPPATSPSDRVPTPTPLGGYLPYSNAQFHFSLSYPKKLQVQEYNEQGGAFTVTFQDTVADQEVQVYVTPYGDTQITDARFKLDEPSGVKINPTDVFIDGARGIQFFSNAPRMNDTREVWFVHGGLLYEVTTYKELDAWLKPIMQSWQFI